jgi:DNA-binding response OmpR family regulator
VLVVEDALTTRSILEQFFVRSGYNVLVAADPDIALRRLKKSGVAAIVLDVRLADNRSGLEVLELIRLDGRFIDLPVVVLTGATLEPHEHKLIRRHRAHLLFKKQGFREVLERLDQILKSVASEPEEPIAVGAKNVGLRTQN